MDPKNLERLRQYRIRRLQACGLEDLDHTRARRIVIDSIERHAKAFGWSAIVKVDAAQAAINSLSLNASPTVALLRAAEAGKLSTTWYAAQRSRRAIARGLH